MTPKHFLDLDALDTTTLRHVLDLAKELKREPKPRLAGKHLAMIFEKNSTRTRVSFEVAMSQLGGHAVVMSSGETHLARGESLADTARVLSRYVDAVMIRTTGHGKLLGLAEHATVPVINGLTDRSHPCQIMADVLTFEEHKGPIEGARIAWVGDANNVATSWIHAAVRFGFDLHLACPKDLAPDPTLVEWAGPRLTVTRDPVEAVIGADAVVTDTWVSMGQDDGEHRIRSLTPYQVNEALMAKADRSAIFMHCLPAHRGQEVTDAVMDGPRSVVFDEAENRLHVQKGILAWCLS
ncbi:MAG: ornithine carbamoyltransferase [Geminicoccaceae bacterium]|nr:MAG: ornithine carbamoyltransferase [Geminicoccaceae bacterium]